VIVSEESGAISMAVGGKIERDLTVEQLREHLSTELRRYMSPVALRRWWRRTMNRMRDCGRSADERRSGFRFGNGAPAVKDFFKRWVLHNFWLKVLSLLMATGLWLAISPDQEPAEVAIRVPIEFSHVPQGLEISSTTIPEAQIRVRGPERLIRELRTTDIHAELELADAKPGERTFRPDGAANSPPADLHVVQVVPGRCILVSIAG